MQWFYQRLKKAAKIKRDEIFRGSERTITLPNDKIRGDAARDLLKCNQEKGSDITRKLIEYFHAPVDCHVENMENGALYKKLVRATYTMLNISREEVETIVDAVMAARRAGDKARRSGLMVVRDEVIPIVVDFFHIRFFGRRCEKDALAMLSRNVIDFKESISFISLPDMQLRGAVLEYIRSMSRLALNKEAKEALSAAGDDEQSARLIQGVFFHTGVIQISELVAHALVALSQNKIHQDALKRELHDDDVMQRVLNETLRLYPLFGITNRIAERDYSLNDEIVISEGMNIIFDFVACHQEGFTNPTAFNPERWLMQQPPGSCYMPFGAGARMCPAQRFVVNIASYLIRHLLKNYSFISSIEHDRALTGGGLVYFFTDRHDLGQRLTCRFMRIFIAIKEAVIQRRFARRVIRNCHFMKRTDFLIRLANTAPQDMHMLR